jgi:phenylacetic acid degradation operon negative regulatory protein
MPVRSTTQNTLGECQPRRLIVTIYGLYARSEQNWLSVAALVRMMADLGVEGPAVRASVSRLNRRGVLHSVRPGGTAGYALSASSLKVLRQGDTRIFDRHRAALEDGWVLLVFSVPEKERNKRHELRTRLTTLGFGTVASGVWIAPGHLVEEARDVLISRGLDRYVDIFRAEYLAFADIDKMVGQWWDLNLLSDQYGQFIDRYATLSKRLGRESITNLEAFVEYIPMLTSWRRLPYLDPGLPIELLPARWNGITAAKLFFELNDYLAVPAHHHALSLVHR